MEVIINQYDIIERLDDIINNLQELRDVSEGKEKEQKIEGNGGNGSKNWSLN